MNGLRIAARTLFREKSFTVIIAGALATGIGVNITLFALFNAVSLRPLPVSHPEELVRLVQRLPRIGTSSRFHPSFFRALRDHSEALSAVIGEVVLDVAMNEPSPATQIRVSLTTPHYLEILGVRPVFGHVFTEGDSDSFDGTPQVVLSYDFWIRRFDGDKNIVGQTIVLNRHRFVVTGVTPRGFSGSSIDSGPDVRAPLSAFRLFPPLAGVHDEEALIMEISGRLKPGVTLAQAQSECSILWQQVMASFSADSALAERARAELRFAIQLDSLKFGTSIFRDRFGTTITIITLSAGVLLLLVCANVGALLLARAVEGRGQTALRLALGAKRIDILKVILADGAVLTLLGAVGGVLVALVLKQLLPQMLPPIRDLSTKRLDLSLSLDWDFRVLIFSILTCLVTTALFSIAPALFTLRLPTTAFLRDVGRTGSLGGYQILTAVQIALSTLLLIAAGLFINTFVHLDSVNPGFDRDHVVTLIADPSTNGYTDSQEQAFLQVLLTRVQAIPGVQRAAIAFRGVMRGSGVIMTIAAVGAEPINPEFQNTSYNIVNYTYFDTMGMHILAGRDFSSSDRTDLPISLVVVNEAFARHFFPDGRVIGRRFGKIGGRRVAAAPEFEVIGVVNDGRYRSLREAVPPTFYALSNHFGLFVLHVRTINRPEQLIPSIRGVLSGLDSSLPITEISTLADDASVGIAAERATAITMSLLGTVAIILTSMGIYGLVTYVITARRREIGIRLSLGATRTDIARLFALRMTGVVLVGATIGLASAALGAKLVGSLLYGISPIDTGSYVVAAAVSVGMSICAMVMPLLSAIRSSPSALLRRFDE